MTPEPATPPSIIAWVVKSMSVFTVLGMVACFVLMHEKADPALIGNFVQMTTAAMSILGGMLINTRSRETPAGTVVESKESSTVTTIPTPPTQ